MSYKVKLEIFEGPLDLLLHLVKQNHLEIGRIPIAQITDQYLRTLELMQALDLDIAGEFLVMAATLMQIKSRMLLPPEALTPEEQEEPDPAQELVQRLLEYQRFKQAAERLEGMEKNRLVQLSRAVAPAGEVVTETEELKEASLFDLLNAFSSFLKGQVSRELFHEIIKDEFTVEEKVALLRQQTRQRSRLSFTELFGSARSTGEIVATFLALLELIRLKEVIVRQSRMFEEILIFSSAEEPAGRPESVP